MITMTTEMSQNSISLPSDVQSKSYISTLCDVVVNKNRERRDFESLLTYLESHPKECTPHKRKILEHLKVHGLENPNVDHKLIGSCFARASILFRQTPNKSEGAIGAWKSSLAGELVNLEENLNQLYSTLGISTKSIIEDTNDYIDIEDVDLEEVTSKPNNDPEWQNLINSHLFKVNLAAHYISALISVPTDFNLPIPVVILLRIASRVGKFRLENYRKKPKTNIHEYCYSLTPHLVGINLMLLDSLVDVLGTNVIPFIPLVNSTLSQLLEWTRTSHLLEHEASVYHSLRAQLFKVFTSLVDQLSLNTNLEPQILNKLLATELVDDLKSLFLDEPLEQIKGSDYKDIHIINAIRCLRSIFVAYRGLTEPKLELMIKSVVIQMCLKMYNNYDLRHVELSIRKQLLELLIVIANQPYSTSTTEISYNIFELADRLENDSELKSLIRYAMKVGLAHRPTIVSHHDVYNVYGQVMTSAIDEQCDRDMPDLQQENQKEDVRQGGEMEKDENKLQSAKEFVEDLKDEIQISKGECVEVDKDEIQISKGECVEVDKDEIQISKGECVEEDKDEIQSSTTVDLVEKDEDELQSYMQDFVEKLA